MALLALGINHKTAPVDVREKVAFAPDRLDEAMSDAQAKARVNEIAILSTCNRTEIYCNIEGLSGQDNQALLAWLADHHGLPEGVLQDYVYCHWDDEAVRHMMRVASGLDSLVLGEPQILGQLKTAFTQASTGGFAGGPLGRLFQQTFSVAKKVRTETAIGENPVSVAYAAVSLAQNIFSDLSESRALLVGAGETIELVARHLKNAGVTSLTVANRTLARGQALVDELGGTACLLEDVPDALVKADIVIASTASPDAIITKPMVKAALKKRKHSPIFMVDIAVPRDIDGPVADLDDVYLYTVDDLKEVIEENQKSREAAASEAEKLILDGVSDFMAHLRSLSAVETLTALRSQAEQTRDDELAKALKQLRNGKDAEAVMEQLAKGLTNKLLHHPTIQMRKASAEGRTEILPLVQELYQLESPTSE